MRTSWRRVAAAGTLLAILVLSGLRSRADHPVCQRCGAPRCARYCRLVRQEKKVTVPCWGYEDEEICLPGRGQRFCEHGDVACDERDQAGNVRFRTKRFVWSEWSPRSAGQVKTHRKLMRKTVTKTVPSYRWVVETLCDDCLNQQTAGAEARQ